MDSPENIEQKAETNWWSGHLFSKISYRGKRMLVEYMLGSHGIPVPSEQHTQIVEFYSKEVIRRLYKTIHGLIPPPNSFLYFPK